MKAMVAVALAAATLTAAQAKEGSGSADAGRPAFCVSVTARYPSFLHRGSKELAAEFPGYEWMCCEPNSIAKFRRMGFNCVNFFSVPASFLALVSDAPQCADPADEFNRMIRAGNDEGWLEALVPAWQREPDGWRRFMEEARAIGDTPCYIDFHCSYPSRFANHRAALKGKVDADALFYAEKGKKMAAFNLPFRLTRPEGAEAIAKMWAHSARLYKSLGVKPWAYKLMNEPSYTDNSREFRAQAAEWMRSLGVEPKGEAMNVGAVRWRETLSARAAARIREEMKKVEPDVSAFIQVHNDVWRKAWNGIGLYEGNMAMEIVSIGTGGYMYSGEEPTKGLRFNDARNPMCAEHVAKMAFYRAMAHDKPLVASELYIGGGHGENGNDRSHELEAGLWHAAADGIEMANLWEWGTPKKTGGTISYTLYDPYVCAPKTWDALPRIVKEINALADLFPKGVRNVRTRVACLFPSATRVVAPKRTVRFCNAVAALEFSHVRADAILEEQLVSGDDCRIGDYDVIVAAGVDAIFPGTDAALVRWMDGGGRLVVVDSPMNRDDFGRERKEAAKCLSHAKAVKLENESAVYRLSSALRECLAGLGVRPVAEVRDASTGDIAPHVRVVRAKGRDGVTGWFFANYSTSPRMLVVKADDLAGDVAAFSPFVGNAWPVSGGRMAVVVPGKFHALAVTGRRNVLEARFGAKKTLETAALKAELARIESAEGCGSARPSEPLDISSLANGGFDNRQSFPVDCVWKDASGSSLPGVPYHLVTFKDIRFDIIRFDYNQNRTTMAMRSKSRPEGIADTGEIPVGGQKLEGLAFLHAATHAKDGDVAYAFEVGYADGRRARQGVTVGKEIGSWVVADNSGDMKSSCVWSNWSKKGLFVYEWKNPYPSVPVSTLRIVGGKGESCGNIVAISALLPTQGKSEGDKGGQNDN